MEVYFDTVNNQFDIKSGKTGEKLGENSAVGVTAQLRPEPHSIASHGPDPMDPLQTTRMRNGLGITPCGIADARAAVTLLKLSQQHAALVSRAGISLAACDNKKPPLVSKAFARSGARRRLEP
jgi:hypothetical protein